MVTLFRKSGTLDVKLPKTWKILQTIFKEEQKGRMSLEELLGRALEKPVDSRGLDRILNPGATVAIVVDDLTRPTPIRGLLPLLLKKIHQTGVQGKH